MANESWRLENHGEYYETNFFSRKWQFRNLVLCGISLDKEPSGVRLIQKLYGSHHAWPTRQKLGWRKCKLIFETEGVWNTFADEQREKAASFLGASWEGYEKGGIHTIVSVVPEISVFRLVMAPAMPSLLVGSKLSNYVLPSTVSVSFRAQISKNFERNKKEQRGPGEQRGTTKMAGEGRLRQRSIHILLVTGTPNKSVRLPDLTVFPTSEVFLNNPVSRCVPQNFDLVDFRCWSCRAPSDWFTSRNTR